MSSTALRLKLRKLDGDEYCATYAVAASIERPALGEPITPFEPPDPRVTIFYHEFTGASLVPDTYGAQLAALLFEDKRLQDALKQARAYAEADELPLRICLDLDTHDGALQGLLWETLHDSLHGDRLAASGRVHLSRYLASGHPIARQRRSRASMRGLVAIAAPKDLGKFGLAPIDAPLELQRAREGLSGLQLRVLAREVGEGPATLEAILDTVYSAPDVLYLMCHGTTSSGETILWLETPEGTQRRVPASRLIEGVRNLAQRPSLIVLMSCQSGGPGGDSAALTALGPQLSMAGATAVVAMQGNLSLESAATWLRTFFRELNHDGSVDRACSIARVSIYDRDDWWVPALWLRASDGRIWLEGDEEAPEPLPPLTSFYPPEGRELIGRKAALAAYAEQLARHNLALVCGPAGIGKTNLAITLARQATQLERICWTTFDANDDFGTLLRRLAYFLAVQGHKAFAKELNRASQAAGSGVQNRDLFDRMLEHLRGKGYLICLDDFQFLEANAEDDADLTYCCRRLGEAAAARDLALLVTNWGVPAGLRELVDGHELHGFQIADTRALLLARGVTLPEPLVERLTALTRGNAHELVLATKALAAPGVDPEQVLQDLEEAGDPDLSRMLNERVDQLLEPEQRAVLVALAVIEGHGSRAAIEAVIGDKKSAQVPLLELHDDNLIEIADIRNQVYQLYGLRRQFYYRLSAEHEQQELHRRAFAYFADGDERDILRAARHAIATKGRQEQQAATKLLSAHYFALVNQRQTEGLKRLLAQVDEKQLEPLQQIDLALLCGRTSRTLGELDEAAQHLGRAHFLARYQPPSVAAVTALAETCALLGRFHGLASRLEEAENYVKEGLEAIKGGGLPLQRANLLVVFGAIEMRRQKLARARDYYEEAVKVLAYNLVSLRVDALIGLGTCLDRLGEEQQARARFEEARQVVEYLEDTYRAINVHNDIASYKNTHGDWEGALSDYQRALRPANELGSPEQKARLQLNLGVLTLKRGDLQAAHSHFDEGRQIAHRYGLDRSERNTYLGLADLATRLRDAGAIEEALAAAEPLDAQGECRAERGRLAAEALQLRDDLAGALAVSGEALEAAEADGDDYQTGLCLRTHAGLLAAKGALEEAEGLFARSAELLTKEELYEAARTRLAWGKACRAKGRDGDRHIAEARAVFARLGAAWDLGEADAE